MYVWNKNSRLTCNKLWVSVSIHFREDSNPESYMQPTNVAGNWEIQKKKRGVIGKQPASPNFPTFPFGGACNFSFWAWMVLSLVVLIGDGILPSMTSNLKNSIQEYTKTSRLRLGEWGSKDEDLSGNEGFGVSNDMLQIHLVAALQLPSSLSQSNRKANRSYMNAPPGETVNTLIPLTGL